MVGEDHFTNEIPFFVAKLAAQVKFDNFFCEIDPFLKKAITEGKIKVTDITLLRVINGYDLLVVIPEVTASTFVK